jgi:hypothetical protein
VVIVEHDKAALGRDIGTILADGTDQANVIVRPCIENEIADFLTDSHGIPAVYCDTSISQPFGNDNFSLFSTGMRCFGAICDVFQNRPLEKTNT